ncbi:MAG: class I SAM-dependent methyltransferase [Nanoarchaeota archaeon]
MEFKIISKEEFLKENKKPNQERVWDSIAIPWKTHVVKKIPIVEEFLKKASSLSKDNETVKIVDFGCGTGRNMISDKEITYYGIDFSERQLKQAEKYIKKNKIKAKLYKSKINKLDKKNFKNEAFDCGLFMASLHCLETEKERFDSLKEFYRLLKPKSEALISVWNSEDKRFVCVNNHRDIYISWKENNIPYMRYYYLYYKNEFLDLLKKTRFKILEFYKPREHDRFSKKNWIVRVRK